MNGRMSYHPYQGKGRRVNWLAVLLAILVAGAICFLIPFTVVLAGSHSDVQDEAVIMVILGCQVKEDGPSVLLRDRLDTALDYLADHPDMIIVVSGGKGDDEHISEAQAMYDYLTEHGVDGERILMEDQSRNTNQNIHYTKRLLAAEGYDVTAEMLVVSNGFHLARVRMLWGPTYNLNTLAAPSSHLPTLIWMYIREPLALVKSFFFDHTID